MALTDCLLNCLREVRLERFHQNFTERGLTNCEQLSSLIVDDYSRFGVVSTDDRRRLFQLIHIIKSVQADGVHCQHGTAVTATSQSNEVPQTTKPNAPVPHQAYPKEELPDVTRNGVIPAPKIAAAGDADAGKYPVAPTRQFIKPISDDRGYRVQYKQRCEQPRLHITQETRVVTKNVAVATDSGRGTPTFSCKKMLTFSDSDIHSDDADSNSCGDVSAKPSLQSQISNSVMLSSPAARQNRLRPPQVVRSTCVTSPRAFVIPAECKPMTRHRSSGNRVSQTESQNGDGHREFHDGRESHQTPQNGQLTTKSSSRNNSRGQVYFPTAKIPAPEEPPTHIEQIYHSSGYNYGVPGSAMQLADKVQSVRISACYFVLIFKITFSSILHYCAFL